MATTTWTQTAGMVSDEDVDNLESYSEQALASKNAAAVSETNAAASASTAATQAGQASTSASGASTSASAASASASTATTQASASAASASASATSASNAATSESNASASANTATTKAGEASNSAASASSSATDAQTAQAATELVYDNFDDRYLGAKATDPTVDNDGNALINGALYFDTNNGMKVYALGTTAWLRTTPTSGDQANINTVADISANVTTVAGINANVTTVAGISANVTAVANISANVTSVAADATDIGIVSTNIANVNIVAGIDADVTTVADNIASVIAADANATAAAASASAASGSAAAASSSASAASGSASNAAASASAASGSASSAEAAAASATNTAASLVGFDLAAISDTIAVSAVDVFVYDTSKDSDGGAWRKRTQGTSWYNETLGTSTRGSRKEFPAVAVIVAEAATVTIYDGDDPAMPMWMVFNTATGYHLSHSPKSSVKALNGTLAIGIAYSVGQGLVSVCFIKDSTDSWNSASHFIKSLPISGRNSVNTTTNIGVPYLVNNIINDVAMTVLPNAPIDAATGLPVPTIAVATDGGVSVIKDDGTVVDSAYTGNAGSISFTDDNGLLFALHSAATHSSIYLAANDVFTADAWAATIIGGSSGVNGFPVLGTTVNDSLFSDGLVQVAQAGGLPKMLWNGTEAESLLNYTTSSYNTGWMNGDIKGAFLSDTDTTSLVGGELVTNGTFADTSSWVLAGDATISGGVANFPTTVGSNVTQLAIIPAGTAFDIFVSFDQTITTGTRTRPQFRNGINGGNATVYARTTSAGTNSSAGTYGDGTFGFYVRGEDGFTLVLKNDSSIGTWDNVTATAVDADRSANNNSLTINGTITKTAVATGADLVAYSGFSTSNYLEQPYNSDLDFGTGDFCVMGWGKTNINGTFLSRGDGVSAGSWYWRHMSGSSAPFYIHDGTAFRIALNVALPQGDLVHFALLRRSGQMFLYGNGELMGSLSGTYSALTVTNLTAKLRIGDQQHSSYSGAGERQALLRISATAPSAAQISKIYNDEKFLFQDGAQATLYGASDAVTALAYDDATDLLHVGTSARTQQSSKGYVE